MASPLAGHRQRLARHSLSSTPARSSPLAKSPSTPYDVYRERQQHAGTRFGHASVQSNGSSGAPATPQSSSVFVSPASPNSYASTYRRNAGFGSPGAAAIRASPQMREQGTGTTSIGSQSSASPHGSGSDQQRGMHVGGPRRSSRFVRRKPWKQRCVVCLAHLVLGKNSSPYVPSCLRPFLLLKVLRSCLTTSMTA